MASVAAEGVRWPGTRAHNAESGLPGEPSISSKVRPLAERTSTLSMIVLRNISGR